MLMKFDRYFYVPFSGVFCAQVQPEFTPLASHQTLALDVITLKLIAFCELNVSDSAIAISACFIGSF